ncbi:conjugative transfer signal peptidase TraF [Massilia sp. TS11]|uniref:conjugative transfer signal peptidase TraF n=1 Tax=Massilia sp. TS11 TaxID=2908003 RepID=UPI001EDC82F8|nr:conjugative transfer signal peptidase TraF [Massilia sp. TS11]MCG2583885.1 conjugative transfer signal peptidase TraF [Massilia sp. TS11]
MTTLREDLRRHWFLYVLVSGALALMCARLLLAPTPLLPLVFNVSGSLPYHVAWLRHGNYSPARGDYVVFAFSGPGVRAYPGLAGQPFFKRVAGVAGDEVAVVGRRVYVNGIDVGQAKTHTFDGRALDPITPARIPPGYFYAQGTSDDSFDSRYALSGFIRVDQVIGRVTPLW